MALENAAVGRIVVETEIEAAPAAVWKALTTDIARWWPRDFYTGGEDGIRRFILEPRPGGRMFEQWTESEGLLWATVNTVIPNRRLDVFGVSFPLWGGPTLWLGSWEFEAKARATRVRFTEASVGVVSDASVADKEQGWRFLFDGALRAYVEGREPAAWSGPTGTLED